MQPNFRSLFNFASNEVKAAFAVAQPTGFMRGLKLIKAPAAEGQTHGKLLVITARASGKAHQRNLLRRRAKAIFYEEKLYQEPAIWILLTNKRAIGISFDTVKAFLLKSTQPKPFQPSHE